MPNPPTFNDLKRLRSGSREASRRFSVVGIIVNRPKILPLTLEPFVTPNTIGVDLSNSLAASQSLPFAVQLLYTGQNTRNTKGTDNLIFYPGTLEVNRVLDTPFNKSLWSVDGQKIQLSNNFSYPLPPNNFTVKEEFYNEENSNVSSQSFTVSTVLFSNTDPSRLEIFNFTDTNTITISTDSVNNYGRFTPIAFEITLIDGSNKIYIDRDMLSIDPISAYKDGIFQKSINSKIYPIFSQSYTVTAGSYVWKSFITNGARLFNFSNLKAAPNSNDFLPLSVPLSSTNITSNEFLSANYLSQAQGQMSDEFKFSLGDYKNEKLNNGLVLFQEYLSAGNYEFKINLRDKSNSNNNYTNTVSLSVVEVVNDMRTRSVDSLISIISGNPDYTNNTHLRVLSSVTAVSGGWSSDFWGFSARDVLNFSGVCWNSQLGDVTPTITQNNATLITPRHAVAAEHYYTFGQAWGIGDEVFFFDHTTGESVSAVIQDEFRLDQFGMPGNSNPYVYSNYKVISSFFDVNDLTNSVEDLSGSRAEILTDVQLLYLDRDVTQGKDIKVYPLSRRANPKDWTDYKYPLITTGGRNKGNNSYNVGICGNKGTNLDPSLGFFSNANYNSMVYYPNLHNGVPNGMESASFYVNKLSSVDIRIPETYSFGKLIARDSGAPTFHLVDGKLSLYTTNFVAGGDGTIFFASGPDYGAVSTHVILQCAVDAIGNTEGYKLSTIDIV